MEPAVAGEEAGTKLGKVRAASARVIDGTRLAVER
jgi:hypothetical protein